MELFTQYSIWWAVPCLALGALYAFILYRKEDRLEDASKWLVNLLAALRAITVALIAFLLLGPFFKTIERQIQKPVVLLAQDNSSSMVFGTDSTFIKGDYQVQLNKLIEDLSEKYEVQTYTFDSELNNGLNLDFTGQQTNLSSALQSMLDRNVNRNIGAMIIGTDGIYNRGMSPAFNADRSGIPIFPIALGDTTIRRDLILENVTYNRLAYLGNEFPMEVLVRADRLASRSTVVSVKKDGQILFRKTIDINEDVFTINIPVQLKADKVGRQRYNISLAAVSGELSTVNNYQSVYIDVLDSRQKVLIVYQTPHPDIGALRQAIESNENYEVQVSTASSLPNSFKEYDLVILHGIPSIKQSVDALLSKLKAERKATWFIASLNTNINALSKTTGAFEFGGKPGLNTTDALPSFNRDFTLFKLSDGPKELLSSLAPLKCLFGDFKTTGRSQNLFNQRIGIIETEQPLWLFTEVDGVKSSLILGEGIWRWRLIDHLENQNHNAFNEIVSRSVQYLASKEDKRQFRTYGKSRFDQGQDVILEAELYNRSFELINDPEVTLECINENGQEYDFTFSRRQSSYYLNAGRLPVGTFNYTARTRFEGKDYTSSGRFDIEAMQIETVRTTANHQLLFNMAQSSGGELITIDRIGSLASIILSDEEIVPVIYTTDTMSELIDLRWIFFLFLVLLAIEWFVRKFKGSY